MTPRDYSNDLKAGLNQDIRDFQEGGCIETVATNISAAIPAKLLSQRALPALKKSCRTAAAFAMFAISMPLKSTQPMPRKAIPQKTRRLPALTHCHNAIT